MSEKMTIKQLATGPAGPRWVHFLGYGLALIAAALPVWQQVDDTFEFTNTTLIENRRHFDETPIEASVMVEGLGMVTLQYFSSDRCTRVFRDDTSTARWITYEELSQESGIRWGLLPVALAAEPECLSAEAHPDDPKTRLGDRDGEMVQVHYAFEDGCRGWSWCHVNGSYCETNKDGTLAVQWDRCVH